jgi:hypothetical protein
VKNADPWPEMQRYDFFVRTRKATGEDFDRDRAMQRDANRLVRNRLAAALRSVLAEVESLAKWPTSVAAASRN